MYELTNYDEARKALAICASIDEVKDIQDKSEAMRLYAKMSENTELEVYASTIKLRAQVRLGEIIAGMEKAAPFQCPSEGTLGKREKIAAAGISKSSAHKYEQAAAMPEETIENIITKATNEQKPISLNKILNGTKPPKPKPATPPQTVTPEPQPEMVTIEKEQYEEMKEMLDASLEEEKALADMLDAEPNDRLAAATAQIKQLVEQVRLLKMSLDGANNRNNEYLSMIKIRDRKITKLEKELDAYKIDEVGL